MGGGGGIGGGEEVEEFEANLEMSYLTSSFSSSDMSTSARACIFALTWSTLLAVNGVAACSLLLGRCTPPPVSSPSQASSSDPTPGGHANCRPTWRRDKTHHKDSTSTHTSTQQHNNRPAPHVAPHPVQLFLARVMCPKRFNPLPSAPVVSARRRFLLLGYLFNPISSAYLPNAAIAHSLVS